MSVQIQRNILGSSIAFCIIFSLATFPNLTISQFGGLIPYPRNPSFLTNPYLYRGGHQGSVLDLSDPRFTGLSTLGLPGIQQRYQGQSQDELALLNEVSVSPHPEVALIQGQGRTRGGYTTMNGNYTLEWEVEAGSPSITFEASRLGPGFVGFAISPTGGMAGADIFIAGIGPNGAPFANDYHHEYQPGGVGSAVPDRSNDYQVLGIREVNGRTIVRFQRLLDTRDPLEDIAIENKVQHILWAIGPPSRDLQYHGPNSRGVVQINLLSPPPAFRLSGAL